MPNTGASAPTIAHSPQPKLYHLTADPAENHNLAEKHLEKVTDLAAMIEAIIGGSAR